ncbi:OLC1v1038055C1 [Oldenlandia corymbosa var. corymbosa]|uniref:OLC1v1038055C1 n=1 Tax=Oldenlandia corymbosa var. corymbosa TaxID=529605 RepID=A0AAV1CZ08_OLDCO|nr:OLC1v1038055C1 [Oldenlandia corymbosa var. corymbosa]
MGGDGVASEDASHNHQVLKVLGALKEASHQLQRTSSTTDSSNSSIKALLDLEFLSKSILSSDRQLSGLSSHLSDLKNLIQTQEISKPRTGLRSFLANRVRAQEISRVANSIESEIQAWIDRENVANLTKTLEEWSDEESLLTQLSQLRNRLALGFDIDLQNTLLKSRLISELESLLCRTDVSKRVREMVAYSLKEVVLFNKDVFIGEIRVGQIIKALVSIGSFCALEVLKSLIKAIKSPLVDELESCGGINKIINALDSADMATKIMAVDCLMEVGYYGRKEAIEAMLNGGLIKKLVYLQRSELSDLEQGKSDEFVGVEKNRRRRKISVLEGNPFASCVARFAVQLEIGEGLRQREKRAFKQEILKRIREASISDAEAATIIAEVLWGSSP